MSTRGYNSPCAGADCGQTTKHFLLQCPLLQIPRQAVLAKLNDFENSFETLKQSDKVEFLLHGSKDLDPPKNKMILNAIAEFVYEGIALVN